MAALLAGCAPQLVVGDLACPPSAGGVPSIDANGVFQGCGAASNTAGKSSDGGTGGATSPGVSGAGGEMSGGGVGGDELCPEGGANGNGEGPLPVPWRTGFEAGFCNYDDEAGFCYSDSDSGYRLVTSPVHNGTFAAAFEMSPSSSSGERQTRCVREGVLPIEAYYSAWYYVPSDLPSAHDWNLFHFAGGRPGTLLHGLWDVSMDDSAGRGLAVFIYGAVGTNGHFGQADPKPIPKDRWFQLEFYLKRAADATGEVALYQDGEELIRRANIVTDDSPFGQWYVGNYTGALDDTPATVSVYVDDVTIRLP